MDSLINFSPCYDGKDHNFVFGQGRVENIGEEMIYVLCTRCGRVVKNNIAPINKVIETKNDS